MAGMLGSSQPLSSDISAWRVDYQRKVLSNRLPDCMSQIAKADIEKRVAESNNRFYIEP